MEYRFNVHFADIVGSSANISIYVQVKFSCRASTNNKNNIGPKTDPCCTPFLMDKQSDGCPSIETNRDMSVTYDVN